MADTINIDTPGLPAYEEHKKLPIYGATDPITGAPIDASEISAGKDVSRATITPEQTAALGSQQKFIAQEKDVSAAQRIQDDAKALLDKTNAEREQKIM